MGMGIYNDRMPIAVGFVHAYLHTSETDFVKVGTGEKQGYYRIKPESIIQEQHVKNLVVDEGSKFVTKRMVPGTSWGNGINYIELGTGVGTGTTQTPEAESPLQTELRTPLLRKSIGSWTYLDDNGTATTAETNRIQLSTEFIETEANGALVEMGMFGGDASAIIGSGYMFNYKVFPVWNKDDTMKLTVSWVLTF